MGTEAPMAEITRSCNNLEIMAFTKTFENLFCSSLGKEKALEELSKISLPKGICGKWLDKDYGWFCQECCISKSSLICTECFEHSNHTGHHVYLDRRAKGSCACGNQEVLRREGFCPDHQGKFLDSTKISGWFPIPLQTSIPEAIDVLVKRFFKTLLYNVHLEGLSDNTELVSTFLTETYQEELEKLIKILSDTANINVAVMHEICLHLTEKRIPDQLKQFPQRHSFLGVLDQRGSTETIPIDYFKSGSGGKNKVFLSRPLSAIDALFLSHSYWNADLRKSLRNFILQCIKIIEFRKQLCITYFNNLYNTIVCLQSDRGKLSKMCFHIICNEDIMLEILKSNENILKDFIRLIKCLFFDSGLDNDINIPSIKLEIVQKNFSLLMTTKTTLYALQNTTFMNELLEVFITATARIKIVMLEMHIETEGSFLENSFDAECSLLKIFQIVANSINYLDLEFCKLLGEKFQEALEKVAKILETTTESYYILPLHRSFAIFLMNFISTHMVLNNKEPKELILSIMKFKTDEEYNFFYYNGLIIFFILFEYEIDKKINYLLLYHIIKNFIVLLANN